MFNELRARLKQGYRTIPYPKKDPEMLPLYRGLPIIKNDLCQSGCSECANVCPTNAISKTDSGIKLDMGRCLFCTDCVDSCPTGAISFSKHFRMATSSRSALVIGDKELELATELGKELKSLVGRSLRLRQVSAGGCNGCEADTNVLGTIGFDLSRFGIQFVASPRHADGLLITGPVSKNMKLALQKTYEALPTPKLVIAVGACAISGGPFLDHEEVCNGATDILPVNLFIPGCPPHPMTILSGLVGLLGKDRRIP